MNMSRMWKGDTHIYIHTHAYKFKICHRGCGKPLKTSLGWGGAKDISDRIASLKAMI
jgi:hypothetical protein